METKIDAPILRINGSLVEGIIDDEVAAELPITLILNGEPLVTLLCTPLELKELTIGFLLSEGVLFAESSIKKWSILFDKLRTPWGEPRSMKMGLGNYGQPLIGRNDPLGEFSGMHFLANACFVQELDGGGHGQHFLKVKKTRTEILLRSFGLNQANGFSPFGKHEIDLPLFFIPEKV